jgi:hypothetical protein
MNTSSVFHLTELLFVRDLFGTFCFSMQLLLLTYVMVSIVLDS